MIAYFNLKETTFDIKCSKFEQFDGFEAKENTGRDNRVRPADFEAKRDLFFRWLNPIYQGDTYLEYTKDGQEMVMRGKKGRKRLRPRKLPPKSSSCWKLAISHMLDSQPSLGSGQGCYPKCMISRTAPGELLEN